MRVSWLSMQIVTLVFRQRRALNRFICANCMHFSIELIYK